MRTVATEMLGIEHPIVCGGMTATGSAELCIGVANAGGLGMLTCLHCRTPERLDLEIAKARAGLQPGRKFGVNLTILGEKRGEPEYPDEFIEVITRNKIEIVETCGGGVELMRRLHAALREGGVTVILSKCVQVKHALTAQNELGADMISLMGFDSGGLPGEADTGVFVQMALASKLLRIPFLASGGVATGRQLLAALALGAAGVQIGTRFNCTQECTMFPDSFKQRMVDAGVRDTVLVMRPFKATSRVLKNRDADEMIRIERSKGASLKFTDYADLAKFDRLREGMATADPDRGVWNCGQSVALIDDVPTCLVMVRRLIAEAEEAYRSVGSQVAMTKSSL